MIPITKEEIRQYFSERKVGELIVSPAGTRAYVFLGCEPNDYYYGYSFDDHTSSLNITLWDISNNEQMKINTDAFRNGLGYLDLGNMQRLTHLLTINL